MKTALVFLVVITAISCSKSSTINEALKKEADSCMKGAMDEANHWLTDFNQRGYALFLDLHFPPVFEKAIFESMDSIQRQAEFQKWVNGVEQEFGKVQERELVGIHIILEGKLLTHLANGKQGFQETSPRRLGLHRVNQLYLKNIPGTYAYVMYESKPTKKDRAEEMIVLWLDESNKWNFITYKIADDV